MEKVCKHFQCGFCKFGESCKKQHIKHMCLIQSCTSKSCIKRHPKNCKYFSIQQSCKFGDHCAYKHNSSSDKSDHKKCQDKIAALEASFEFLKAQMYDLTEELDNIKSEKHKVNVDPSFECEICEYKASTKTVLKRHTTAKHKQNIPPPEKERNEDLETSLTLLVPLEEREEVIYSPPQPVHKDFSKTSSSLHFKCNICQHETVSEAALHGHKSLKHNTNIPHTSQWDKKKCHICNNVFTETTLFKNHMITQHGFSDEHSAECMNCESTELGDYRPVPSQHIFMNCKNCELLEAES